MLPYDLYKTEVIKFILFLISHLVFIFIGTRTPVWDALIFLLELKITLRHLY